MLKKLTKTGAHFMKLLRRKSMQIIKAVFVVFSAVKLICKLDEITYLDAISTFLDT